MKPDIIVAQLLSQNEKAFARKEVWAQVQMLERAIDQWENLKRVSPRQHHLWSKKFWEMSEWFCANLINYMPIYNRKLNRAPSRQPPNFSRFLKKLYTFDPDRAYQLMMKQPGAFAIVDEPWALWTRIIV